MLGAGNGIEGAAMGATAGVLPVAAAGGAAGVLLSVELAGLPNPAKRPPAGAGAGAVLELTGVVAAGAAAAGGLAAKRLLVPVVEAVLVGVLALPPKPAKVVGGLAASVPKVAALSLSSVLKPEKSDVGAVVG